MLLTLWGTPGRRRALVLAAGLLGVALVWPAFEADLLRAYGDQRAIVAVQRDRGYALVGTLGRPQWPALVLACDSGAAGVSFVTAGGQPHRYEGFSGPMKALHLRSLPGGSAFTLVFHRAPTRARDVLTR